MDGTYVPLKKKHVDTGIGVERLTAIVEGVSDNYRTDLFLPVIEKFREITGAQEKYGDGEKTDSAFRLISDHVRMMTIAISDGVRPGTKNAEGVLRHVMRRALRAGYAVFEIPETPFLSGLVSTVAEILGDFYEGLDSESVEKIIEVVKQEEELFQETHVKGRNFLLRVFAEVKKGIFGKTKDEEPTPGTVIPGSQISLVLHRYGVPVEFSKKLAAKHGMTINEQELEEEEAKWREEEQQQKGEKKEGEKRDNRRTAKVLREEKKEGQATETS